MKPQIGSLFMRRLFVLIASGLTSIAASSFAQEVHTQSISFDDGVGAPNAGIYSPGDHFSVNLYLTFSGYDSRGYTLFFHTTADAAPFITLTDRTYGSTFTNFNFLGSFPLPFTLSEANGFYTTPNQSDMGASHGPVPPGTYFIGDLSVDLGGLPPGTYILATDDLGPHRSISVDCDSENCHDNLIPSAAYTITVIPEPSTVALLGFGLAGAVYMAAGRRNCRRQRSS